MSPDGARSAEAEGHGVLRGDYSRRRTLELAGLDRARLIVVADDQPALTERVLRVVHTRRPDLPILIRTRFTEGKAELGEAGATHVIAEEEAGIAHLVAGVLSRYEIAAHRVRQHAGTELLAWSDDQAANNSPKA